MSSMISNLFRLNPTASKANLSAANGGPSLARASLSSVQSIDSLSFAASRRLPGSIRAGSTRSSRASGPRRSGLAVSQSQPASPEIALISAMAEPKHQRSAADETMLAVRRRQRAGVPMLAQAAAVAIEENLAPATSAVGFDPMEARKAFTDAKVRIKEKMGRLARHATSDFSMIGMTLSLTAGAITPILMLTLASTVPPLTAVVGVFWLITIVAGALTEALLKRRAFKKVDDATLKEIDELYATLCAREAQLGAGRSNDELSLLNDVNELIAQMVGGTWHLFRQMFADLIHWSSPCPRFAPGALQAARRGEAVTRFVPMAAS